MLMDQLVSALDARPLNRQEFYRHVYQRLAPGWKDSLARYCQIIDAYTRPDTSVLDIGCGHADFLAPVYARTPYTYGLDPDAAALKKNRIVKYLRLKAGGFYRPVDLWATSWPRNKMFNAALWSRSNSQPHSQECQRSESSFFTICPQPRHELASVFRVYQHDAPPGSLSLDSTELLELAPASI
jgi:SAM-dependent methyltransferase